MKSCSKVVDKIKGVFLAVHSAYNRLLATGNDMFYICLVLSYKISLINLTFDLNKLSNFMRLNHEACEVSSNAIAMMMP